MTAPAEDRQADRHEQPGNQGAGRQAGLRRPASWHGGCQPEQGDHRTEGAWADSANEPSWSEQPGQHGKPDGQGDSATAAQRCADTDQQETAGQEKRLRPRACDPLRQGE